MGRREVEAEDLLLGVLGEQDGISAALLSELG